MSKQLENKELDYSSVVSANPSYRYRKVGPNEAQPTLALTAPTSSSFTIPASVVFNLAKSYITATIAVPSQVADFVNLKTGCLSIIQALKLTSERGAVLCEILNVPSYTNCVFPVCTSLEEFYNMGDSNDVNCLLIRSGKTSALAPTILNTGASADDVRSFENNQQFVSSGADATGITMLVNIPLGMLYHTFLAEKADLYLQETLQLDITWANVNDWAFDSDDLALANAGNLAVVATMTASTLYMYLALQQNEDIIMAVKNQVLGSGLNLVSQFVSEYKEATGTGTSYAKTNKINASRGAELLRCYHALELHSSANSLKRNINNRADSKFSVSRLYLNNVPESDFALTCAQRYAQSKDVFKNSLISCSEIFSDLPVVVQDFSGVSGVRLKDERVRGGKALVGSSVEVGVEYTKTGADYTYYMFAVTNKNVRIGVDGITISV